MNKTDGVYNSYWSFKRIGQSIEVRTPLVTIGNLFVTVFVTKRKNYYVVTDGGWIDNGTYDEGLPIGETTNMEIAKHLASNRGLKMTSGNGRHTYFYATLSDKSDLPIYVLNMASFVCEVVDTSVLNMKEFFA